MTDEERATEYAVAYHTAVGRSIGDAAVIPAEVDEAARQEAREHVRRCEEYENTFAADYHTACADHGRALHCANGGCETRVVDRPQLHNGAS